MIRVQHGVLLCAALMTLAACDDPSVGAPEDIPGDVPGDLPGGSSGGAGTGYVSAAPSPGFGQIDVVWKALPGATSYNVYWGTTAGITTQTGTKVSTNLAFFHHSGLAANTTYYYLVTAVSDTGEGAPFATTQATASGDIGFGVLCPTNGAPGGTPLNVGVEVVSRYQLSRVTASVGGRSVDLVFDPLSIVCSRGGFAFPRWVGAIPLSGLPGGGTTLSITVTDAYGNVATGSFGFVHDEPPSLTIVAPDDFYVARSAVRVTTSCVNDAPGGCAYIYVYVNGSLVATAPGNFDDTVSVAAYEGKSVELRVEGFDGAGQFSRVYRRVFVESSTHLSEVVSVNGLIMDVQPDRILFLNQSTGGNALTIRNRMSGSDVVIYDVAGHLPESGGLTPVGAIFAEKLIGHNDTGLHEWTAGGVSDLGSYGVFDVEDRYATFVSGGLVRRDVVAGANTFVTSGASTGAVAANGDVVYGSSGYQIVRFRNGTSTQLTSDATLWNVAPVTDGVNVVYAKSTPCCSGQQYQIAMYGASGEQILTVPDGVQRWPGRFYRAANGWIAYTKSGAGGELNIWSRSPTGQIAQATQFGGSSIIDALGPNGEIAVVNLLSLGNGMGTVQRRYLAVPNYGGVPTDISSGLGSAYFLRGGLYLAIGRSLFQVSP